MSTVLSISSLSLFPIEKADASVLNEPVLEASILGESNLDGLFTNYSIAGSGWQTKSGITAKISTNKNNYKLGEDILVNAEKTAAGGKIYYEVVLLSLDISKGMWFQRDRYGFASTTGKIPQIKFRAIYGVGPYRVMLKAFSDPEYDKWLGDWETSISVN